MTAKSNVHSMAVVFFLVGLLLTIIAESAGSVTFLSGLLLFITSIVIFLASMFWEIAKKADDFFSNVLR